MSITNKNILVSLIFLIFLSFSCTGDPYEIPEPDTSPPQALVIYPIDGEPVSGIVTIEARANDNEKVTEVLFYINQEFVGKDTTTKNDIATYEWNTSISEQNDDGTLVKKYTDDEYHFISVVAYDLSDNKYSSVPIRSFVDNIDGESPSAFFLTPFSGQYITGTTNITVVATDNVGIQFVSYFINNVLQEYVLPIENSSTFEFPWNTTLVQSGAYYSLYANVRDVNNNVTIIPPISVYVDNGSQIDITPPNGAIVSPPAGISVNGEVQIIIVASDNRAMGEVLLSIDEEFVSTIENDPFLYIWDTLDEEEDSEHSISVILRDLAGNETPLNPITVFVDNNPISDISPPSVIIMDPVSGQKVSGIIPIEVDAYDESGMSHIDYYVNGILEETDSVSPYAFEWNTNEFLDDQEHIIFVIGFDSEGNSTYHQPITVIVDNDDNIPPHGQFQNPIPGQTLDGFITIQIAATDNVEVDKIELSINGIPRDTLQFTPYSYSWNTQLENEDQYSVLSAIVMDDFGNQFPIPPISVLINNEVNDLAPPTGTISNPLSGQTVSGLVNFTILAQDDSGISEVVFFIDGIQSFTSTNEPYIFEWDTTILNNNSQHTLSATVTDNVGQSILLQPVLISVNN